MGKLILTVAVVSYFLGSIPFGYLLVRIFRGVDVRTSGSGNIGATNVARTGSKGLAILTLLLDGCKGYLAVLLASRLVSIASPDLVGFLFMDRLTTAVCAMAAFFAIIGHMFPLWLRFRGGKGVATAAGAFAALAPRALVCTIVAFAVVVAFTRYVSLGSIVAAVSFPVFFILTVPPVRNNYAVIFFTILSSVFILIRHKDNIHRLRAGTEHRFR